MKVNLQKNKWLHDKGTLVELVPKNALAKSLIEKSGAQWSIQKHPLYLQDESLTEVMRGWLYLRSKHFQYRFVHVLHDKSFEVTFITKDVIPSNEVLDNETDIQKGVLHV